MLVQLAQTLTSYLGAALQNFRGKESSSAPVYDPSGEHIWSRRIAHHFGCPIEILSDDIELSLQDVMDLFHTETEAGNLRSEHLVVTLSNDQYAYPAAVFALLKHCPLACIQSADEISAMAQSTRAKYVTLFGSLDQIRFDFLESLRHKLPTGTSIGVMTARTMPKLSELVMKNVLYARMPASMNTFLAPVVKGDDVVREGNLYSHVGETASARALQGITEMQRLFTVITHGSEDHIGIGEYMLCGRNGEESIQLGELPRATPACAQGCGCYNPTKLLVDPAHIPCQLVFANVCLSLKFGIALFHPLFSISQRFLEGWSASYIASPLLKGGLPFENLLFFYLVEFGFSIGNAAQVVNENLARIGLEVPAVFVVGDPESVYSRTPMPTADPSMIERLEDGVRLGFEQTMPAFMAFQIQDPDLLDDYRKDRLEVSVASGFGNRLPIYACLHDEGTSLYVYVFGFHSLTKTHDQWTVLVQKKRAFSGMDQLLRSLRRYDNLRSMDINLPMAKNAVNELTFLLPALARSLNVGQVDLTEFTQLANRIAKVSAAIGKLDQSLLERLLELTETRSFSIVEAYQPTYVLNDWAFGEQSCPYCGQGLYQYRRSHILYPDLQRTMLSCPTCAIVADADDRDVSVHIEGSPVIRDGAPNHQTIQVTNQSDRTLPIRVGARITNGKATGYSFTPGWSEFLLAPGESRSQVVEIFLEKAQIRHAVLFRVFAINAGRIYFAGRYLWNE